MASTTSTYMSYIGSSLVAIGLFPVICWLAYPFGGAYLLMYGIIAWLYNWSLGNDWQYFLLLWFFLVFMSIFGEIILIPWFLFSIIPLVSGLLILNI